MKKTIDGKYKHNPQHSHAEKYGNHPLLKRYFHISLTIKAFQFF